MVFFGSLSLKNLDLRSLRILKKEGFGNAHARSSNLCLLSSRERERERERRRDGETERVRPGSGLSLSPSLCLCLSRACVMRFLNPLGARGARRRRLSRLSDTPPFSSALATDFTPLRCFREGGARKRRHVPPSIVSRNLRNRESREIRTQARDTSSCATCSCLGCRAPSAERREIFLRTRAEW